MISPGRYKVILILIGKKFFDKIGVNFFYPRGVARECWVEKVGGKYKTWSSYIGV
jgi:hypothetical protein